MISASPLAALLLALTSSVAVLRSSSAFVPPFSAAAPPTRAAAPTALVPLLMSTVINRPGTETERRRKNNRDLNISPPSDEGETRGPVEWLIDDALVSREIDDPYHILLLDATFAENERITIEYVATSCAYVFGDAVRRGRRTRESRQLTCL